MYVWMTHRHEYGWWGTTEEGAVVWLHVLLALCMAALNDKRVKKVGHRSIRCKWWVIWVRKQVFPFEMVGLRPNIEIWKVNPQLKRHEMRRKRLKLRDKLKSKSVPVKYALQSSNLTLRKCCLGLNHLSLRAAAIYHLITNHGSLAPYCLRIAAAVKLWSALSRGGGEMEVEFLRESELAFCLCKNPVAVMLSHVLFLLLIYKNASSEPGKTFFIRLYWNGDWTILYCTIHFL